MMEVLYYREWRDVIEKAKTSCEMAGHFSGDHFVLMPEMVAIGSGARRERENFIFSKYACYCIGV